MSMEKPKTLDVYTPGDNLKPLGIIHFIHGMAEHKKPVQRNYRLLCRKWIMCVPSAI